MSTIANLMPPQAIERLGWTLIHFVWQATTVAALLGLTLRLLRRAGSDIRYIVSCAAMGLIVTLPIVTMQLVDVSGPVAEAGPPPALSGSPGAPVDVIEVAELPALPIDAAPLETADVTVRVPWTQRTAAALEPALPYLVLGWLLGVFGLSAWHLGGWAQLQRMKQRSVHEVAAPLQARFAELTEGLGIRHAVALLESAFVKVPTVIGWIKPVVLLPASALTGLSSEQLEAILAHELAHIRRCDYLVNIAQTVVEILGFYHPAVWWVSCRIRDERENCCDDLAVRISGDSVRYARALIRLEEMRHHAPELAVAANGGSLLLRIARLIGGPAPHDRRFAWLPGLIALFLVASIVIPAALVFGAASGSPTTSSVDSEPNAAQAQMADVEVTARTQRRDDAERQDGSEITVRFVIAEALTAATLDRETILLIGDAFAAENPQVADDIAATASKPNTTLGEILQAYVARKPLTSTTVDTLFALLRSRGYVQHEARPSVQVKNNTPAEIKVVTEELFWAAQNSDSSPQHIELGTAVQITPHFSPRAGDRIRLEIAVQQTERANEAQPRDRPAIRRTEIASTITTLRDRYFSFLVEKDNVDGTPTTNIESLLVMCRTNVAKPPAKQANSSISPARQSDSHPRQVLLDIRAVAVEQGDLANLGIEWSVPQIRTGRFGVDEGSGRPGGVRTGYTPDDAFTDALLGTLDGLCQQGQAQVVARQQVVALDGRQARVTAVTEQWFTFHAPATADQAEPQTELVNVASGTVLSATPTIGDNNEITLEIAIEVSRHIPQEPSSELPIVTRRTSRNVVTVRDGGTVALAGLADSERQVAILVTARILPENGQRPSTQSTGRQTDTPSVASPVD